MERERRPGSGQGIVMRVGREVNASCAGGQAASKERKG